MFRIALSPKTKLLLLAFVVAFVYSLFLFFAGVSFDGGLHRAEAYFVTLVAILLYGLLAKLATRKR